MYPSLDVAHAYMRNLLTRVGLGASPSQIWDVFPIVITVDNR